MAKPLGPKSLLIRDAIKAHPHMGNTELAELINSSDARKEDRIEVKANDIAQQKQAMKKAGESAPADTGKGGGTKRGRKPAASAATASTAPNPAKKPAAAQAASTSSQGGVADHVEAIKKAVDQLGADQVRRLTELFE